MNDHKLVEDLVTQNKKLEQRLKQMMEEKKQNEGLAARLAKMERLMCEVASKDEENEKLKKKTAASGESCSKPCSKPCRRRKSNGKSSSPFAAPKTRIAPTNQTCQTQTRSKPLIRKSIGKSAPFATRGCDC